MKCRIMHCLLIQNGFSQEKAIKYFWEIITCDPSIYTMDHPDLQNAAIPNFIEQSIGPKRVNPLEDSGETMQAMPPGMR